MARYYEISEADARMAHDANSMREFKAGSETEGYRAQVDEAYRMAEKQAERFPEAADKAYALADRFARKYAEWLNEGYRIDAMCPSILVSGGGNFPVRKKERQNARRESHMERYEKVMGIKRRIASIGTGGIQAGDPNALEKLEAKAKRLEDRQDMMKRANAHYRKNGTLEGFDGVGADEAERIKHDMERFGMSKPFPSWQLSNNLATIKRASPSFSARRRPAPKTARPRSTASLAPWWRTPTSCGFSSCSAESLRRAPARSSRPTGSGGRPRTARGSVSSLRTPAAPFALWSAVGSDVEGSAVPRPDGARSVPRG